MTHKDPAIILASGSPRRRVLLGDLGLSFGIEPADIDEAPRPGEAPDELACRLSREKARVVAQDSPEALIVAADTLVVLDGEILGKPGARDEAVSMLESLRGREHLVYTGLALWQVSAGRNVSQLAATPVIMRNYTDKELERYVASGDPMDKAGGYAVQHEGFAPVARLRDCYANVVGLPLCHLYRALHGQGFAVPTHPLNGCPWPLEHGGCRWANRILTEPPWVKHGQEIAG